LRFDRLQAKHAVETLFFHFVCSVAWGFPIGTIGKPIGGIGKGIIGSTLDAVSRWMPLLTLKAAYASVLRRQGLLWESSNCGAERFWPDIRIEVYSERRWGPDILASKGTTSGAHHQCNFLVVRSESVRNIIRERRMLVDKYHFVEISECHFLSSDKRRRCPSHLP
jgi:hypothetical protein